MFIPSFNSVSPLLPSFLLSHIWTSIILIVKKCDSLFFFFHNKQCYLIWQCIYLKMWDVKTSKTYHLLDAHLKWRFLALKISTNTRLGQRRHTRCNTLTTQVSGLSAMLCTPRGDQSARWAVIRVSRRVASCVSDVSWVVCCVLRVRGDGRCQSTGPCKACFTYLEPG